MTHRPVMSVDPKMIAGRIDTRCSPFSAHQSPPYHGRARGGGGVVRGSFRRRKFRRGGNFVALGLPKAPNCLTHTPTCNPMLSFRVSTSPQRRKRPRKPEQCGLLEERVKNSAKMLQHLMLGYPQYGSAMGVFTALPTPLPSLKTRKFPRPPPPPVWPRYTRRIQQNRLSIRTQISSIMGPDWEAIGCVSWRRAPGP